MRALERERVAKIWSQPHVVSFLGTRSKPVHDRRTFLPLLGVGRHGVRAGAGCTEFCTEQLDGAAQEFVCAERSAQQI
jgi:hypothetical protein